MALAVLLIIVVFMFLSDASTDAKNKKHYKECEEMGMFDPVDFNFFRKKYMEFYVNYYHGDKSVVDDEFKGFLEEYGYTVNDYRDAWVQREEMRAGLKPTCVYWKYDKRTYDPMQRFRDRHADEIREYHEKHKKDEVGS